MKINLSIQQNLLITIELDESLKMKNAGIQSYTTMVGFIEDGKLIENGKYSRTTTKHINLILSITGLRREASDKRPFFYWHHYGAKIHHPYSFSSESSIEILKSLSKGESLFESISNLIKMKRRDIYIAKEILEKYNLWEALEQYRKIKGSFALL